MAVRHPRVSSAASVTHLFCWWCCHGTECVTLPTRVVNCGHSPSPVPRPPSPVPRPAPLCPSSSTDQPPCAKLGTVSASDCDPAPAAGVSTGRTRSQRVAPGRTVHLVCTVSQCILGPRQHRTPTHTHRRALCAPRPARSAGLRLRGPLLLPSHVGGLTPATLYAYAGFNYARPVPLDVQNGPCSHHVLCKIDNVQRANCSERTLFRTNAVQNISCSGLYLVRTYISGAAIGSSLNHGSTAAQTHHFMCLASMHTLPFRPGVSPSCPCATFGSCCVEQ